MVQKEFPSIGKWITNTKLSWPKGKTPVPLVFRKTLDFDKAIKKASVLCTAWGIYEISWNGSKVGEDYFAPGFTSYQHQLQYQTYDITAYTTAHNTVDVTVAGGWAVGEFNYNRKSRIAADFPTLLLEIEIEFEDGSFVRLGTDETWIVTEEGPVRGASWYDGEIYDATIDINKVNWTVADVTCPRNKPQILAQYGPPIRVWNILHPVSSFMAESGEYIYDFGQNFAGVIRVHIDGNAGQRIVFRHAEMTHKGELYRDTLRTAQATVEYICKEGEQTYSPYFTYMGFRCVGMTGIEPEKVQIEALAISSELRRIGTFECSNPLLNQLQSNIYWSARSNFIEIPMDCPQRDERLGWTGDISMFAATACFNFDMSKFFHKWLKDVSAEQGKLGGIPMVVPRNGFEWPAFTTAAWGDCCILVPWAEYMARGDTELLRRQYPTMKRFLKSAERCAGLFSIGDNRYIWKLPFQFGDWCAPEESVQDNLKKGKWVATAYFANSCQIVSKVAEIIGEEKDAKYYSQLREKIIKAYRHIFTDGTGRLKMEFQTGYVLPLYFGMTSGEETKSMASHLARLVEENNDRLTTGFTGTPYILFALSDNGYVDVAYRLLLQEEYPSWLYEVRAGATTIWERWDGVMKDGSPNPETRISLNHYANGAVGDWLYRRVLGIEAIEAGYKIFRIAPIMGGGLTWAKGSYDTPYGKIFTSWKKTEKTFEVSVEVPDYTNCELVMPNGQIYQLSEGKYNFSYEINVGGNENEGFRS